MDIKDFVPALVVPFIMVYHRCFVDPIKKKGDGFAEDISELKTDIKWIRDILDRKFNSK